MNPFQKSKRRRTKKIINSFLKQLGKKILAWIICGTGLAILGGSFGNQNFISKNSLGKIYQILTRSQSLDFQKFFLGEGIADRQKLLFYALIFIGAIIFLNLATILINLELKLQDWHIENNKYYIYNSLIFFLNTLTRIASYIVLVLCLVSIQTLIWISLFLIFYTWFSSKNLIEPNTENFFIWQDPIIRKILLFSSLIIFILPFLHARLEGIKQAIANETNAGSLSKIQQLIQGLFNSSPSFKAVWEVILNASSFAHWIILFWFIRTVIFNRIGEYNDFWFEVNKIGKKAINFKHFYYYKNLLNEVELTGKKNDLSPQSKKVIVLGDVFLQITPSFLKKEYLENEITKVNHQESFYDFNAKLKKIIEFIDFVQERLNRARKSDYWQKKVNFTIFDLFNEYQNFADLEKTKKLILERLDF